jgi:heterodisulfide reductase subunit D
LLNKAFPFRVSLAEEEGLRGLKSKVPNKGEVLIFSGCIASYKNRENLDGVIDVLNIAKINYHMMMDDEWCCGAPLIDLGNVDEIYQLAEHNLKAIKAMGVSQVVFLCPHCQETFKNVYPQVVRKELDFGLVFITEFLKDLIDRNKLEPSKSLPYSISYHDPCYLGRYLGDFDSARDILKRIPKIDIVEMNRNREDSYCCGAGGGTKILDYDNSIAIGQERIRDFKKTGAGVLVTACPLCKSQFYDLTKSVNKEIVVKDVVEVLKESLG